MGHYLSVRTESNAVIDSIRVGSNGSGSFLVEQWIAGYAISPEADSVQARKIRQHWLHYSGPLRDLDLYHLAPLENTVRALQDNSEDCGWVRVPDLDRKLLRDLSDRRLWSLVALWHMAHTYYELSPLILITQPLLEATELATRSLEGVGAAWSHRCREATDLLHRAGPGMRLSLG